MTSLLIHTQEHGNEKITEGVKVFDGYSDESIAEWYRCLGLEGGEA